MHPQHKNLRGHEQPSLPYFALTIGTLRLGNHNPGGDHSDRGRGAISTDYLATKVAIPLPTHHAKVLAASGAPLGTRSLERLQSGCEWKDWHCRW